MDRYQTEFWEPLSWDWSNYGTWQNAGANDAQERATAIWQERLAAFTPPDHSADRIGDLQDFIARRTAGGGAAPVS